MLDRLIRAANKIAIGGHEHPDGDCTGSCMGLYLYIQENYPGKQVDVYLEEIPNSFRFLQRSGEIRHELSGDRDYDLFFCLDCGDKERLGFPRTFLTGRLIPFVWTITSATQISEKKIMWSRMPVPPRN